MKRKIISAILAASMGVGALGVFSSSAAAELSLKASSLLVYDEEIGYYKGIDIGCTVSELAENFTEAAVIRDSKGNEVDSSAKIGTDYTVNSGDISRKVVVYGDVNRDSFVNTTDAVLMLRKIAGWSIDINETAADIKSDKNINTTDAVTLLRYLAGWNVTMGYAPVKPDVSKQTAPNEDSTLNLYFGSNTEKIYQADVTDTERYGYKMELAKNEGEFCQAILSSDTEHTGLNVTVSDFTNADGAVLPSEQYFIRYWRTYNPIIGETTPTTDTQHPEEMLPMQKDFTLKANTSQVIVVTVNSAIDQPAGLYRAVLNVTDAEGKVIKTANLYANVWNFALPVETTCKTAFGMSSYMIYTTHGIGTDPEMELYSKYYEYFLDHRINPWCMPFAPTDSRADKYMDDPRVNTFLVAGGYSGDAYGFGAEYVSPEYISEAYEKISTNPEWAAKAIFYLDDEPQTAQHLSTIAGHKALLDKYFPGARSIIPNAYNQDFGEYDTFGFLAENTSVICPCEWYFSDFEIIPPPNNGIGSKYTPAIVEKYGTFFDRYESLREEGKEMWWYTANSPYSPMCNWSQHHTYMEGRTTFWLQYLNNVDGTLYWSSSGWSIAGTEAMNYPRAVMSEYAGVLVYPGKRQKINGPIPALRCEIVRDGIEDFEYLSMIERKYGRDEADKYVKRMATSITEFNKDPEVMYQIRRDMATALIG